MRALGLLLLSFFILGFLFQVATPLFEAPDEIWHIGLAAHLARGGGLPVQRPGEDTPWRQEGSQPPLYYLILAALTRAFHLPLDDLERVLIENRHPTPGDPSLPDNKNMALHGSWERFPWRGAVWTLHLWRMFSLLLGGITLLAVYAALRVMAPDRPGWALGTTALVAWNPMFLFIMGAVNNDVLINTLSAIALWLFASLWRKGPSPSRLIALGLVLGMAALSKLSGLALWLFAFVVLLALWKKHPLRGRKVLQSLVLVYGLAGLLSGWWFLRNAVLYGDPTGLNVMLEIFGRRSPPRSLTEFISEIRGFIWSFWAVWGWFNIVADPPVYIFLEIWGALSALGLILAALDAWRRSNRELLALWAGALGYTGLVLLGLIRWTSLTLASQGRLLFPAIGPIAWMLWVGWEYWIRRWVRRGQRRWIWAPAVIWLVVAWIAPIRYIWPTYAGPSPWTELPPGARMVNAVLGDHLRLVAYRPGFAAPGQRLPITLFWECLRPTERPWSVFLHPVPTARVRDVRQVDRHPGRGLFSTTDCTPGFRFIDPYWVPIGYGNESPTLLRLHIGLWDRDTGWIAPVRDGQGRPIDHLIVEAGKIRGGAQLSPTHPLNVRVGPVRLIGVDYPAEVLPGEAITVTLYWEVETAPGEEWRVFVHAGDLEQPPLLQHDGPPALGDLPSPWWEPGDRFADPHPLKIPTDFPPGIYPLRAGLYRPDGLRAEVIGPGGERPTHRAVELGRLRVIGPSWVIISP
ncbi:ArnT family glycosyltransferase [Thermoflexus sp.]|uniref:ArnT family glycosyltransferase n=1 Tax=Thermoflexus sp. TaxID=1969742 RepID=UPI0035E4043B